MDTNGRLRVLRLTSVYPPPPAARPAGLAGFDAFGGLQSHSGQLAGALDDLGVAQTVVTAWRPGAPRWTALGRHGQVLRSGVALRRCRQLYALAAAPVLPAVSRGCHVVHVHLGEDLAVAPLGLAAARLAAAPLVLTVHCSLRHTFQARGPHAALLGTAGAWLQEVAQRRAVRVIVLTSRTADVLRRGGLADRNLTVIPSGVDLGRFAAAAGDPLPDVRGPRVVYLGRLVAQKDPVTAVRAFARMRADATLVVVGDGPLRRVVEDAARGHGVAHRTRMVGAVNHDRVAAFLRHADVVVVPSVYEELGSVVLEAMAAGVPAVGSSVGGIPSAIEDGVTGLLVAPRDVGGFAGALDRVLSDPGLRAHLGSGARRAAARYDWRVLARRVLDVYHRAAG